MHIKDYLAKAQVQHEIGTLETNYVGLGRNECEDLRGFTDKEYQMGSLGKHYRKVNFWCGKGLLNDSRTEKKGWRRFSLSDIAWFLLLERLRAHGCSLQQLLAAKSSIFDLSGRYSEHYCKTENGGIGDCEPNCGHPKTPVPNYPDNYYPLFEIYLHRLFQGENIFVIVKADGFLEMADALELLASPHIEGVHINFTDVMRHILAAVKVEIRPEHRIFMKDAEYELLRLIRSGKNKEIKIFPTKDGEVDRIEKTTVINNEKTLHEIKQEYPFQKIEIDQRGWKTFAVTQKISQKNLRP